MLMFKNSIQGQMFSAVEGAKNISSIVDDSSIIKLGLFDYKKTYVV